MRVKFDVGKRVFFVLLFGMILFSSIFIVRGYNNQFNSVASNAVILGHSADEVLVHTSVGDRTFQEIYDSGLLASSSSSSAVLMFDTSCPEGWTRFTELDGKVPKGANTYGGIGGEETHTHSATITRSGRVFDKGGGYDPPEGFTVHSSVSWPPYRNVVWCKK